MSGDEFGARFREAYNSAQDGDWEWGEASPELDEGDPPAAEEHGASLPWRWAHEITATVPEEPEWVYERMFGPRDKVMFAGQPKAGMGLLTTPRSMAERRGGHSGGGCCSRSL
jgi:hypothetical protein